MYRIIAHKDHKIFNLTWKDRNTLLSGASDKNIISHSIN